MASRRGKIYDTTDLQSIVIVHGGEGCYAVARFADSTKDFIIATRFYGSLIYMLEARLA